MYIDFIYQVHISLCIFQGCYDALKNALLSNSSSILGLLFTTIFIEVKRFILHSKHLLCMLSLVTCVQRILYFYKLLFFYHFIK